MVYTVTPECPIPTNRVQYFLLSLPEDGQWIKYFHENHLEYRRGAFLRWMQRRNIILFCHCIFLEYVTDAVYAFSINIGMRESP